MKVRSTVRIAGVLVVPFLLCAPRTVRAQAAGDPAQAASPDTQTAAPASAKPAAAQQAPPPTIQTVLQQPVGVATQDTANDLSVTVGKSVVLDLARPITRIVVGLGDYAEAQAVSPTQVLVNQQNRDDRVIRLAGTMSNVFSFVEDADPLKAVEAHKEPIKLLIQQVTECGYFIAEYAKQNIFCQSSSPLRFPSLILISSDSDGEIYAHRYRWKDHGV